MSCRHELANGTCRRCYPDRGTVDPGPEEEYEDNLEGLGAVSREEYLERESQRLHGRRSARGEVKEVNARVVATEIYLIRADPGDVRYAVELQLEYAEEVTQLTGKLRSPYVGRLMQAAGVDRWSDVVGKIMRVRCSREKVYAVGHAVEDVWVEIR